MRSSSLSLGLWAGAAALLTGAAVVHRNRATPAVVAPLPLTPIADAQTHGERLLRQALQADLTRSYTAQVRSETRCNGKVMRSSASVRHTPRALNIAIDGGDGNGLSAGYNQRWTWRRGSQAPMQAVGEMSEDAVAQARRRASLLFRNYRATWLRSELIGDERASVVELVPRRFAPGARGPRRLLAINETGLLVRSQSWDANGQPMCRATFTYSRLDPGAAPDTAFVQPQTIAAVSGKQRDSWLAQQMGRDGASLARVKALCGSLPPRPAYLPPGFELELVGVHRCPFDDDMAAMARYSDGLNTLSVFASRAGADGTLQSCDWGAGRLAVSTRQGGRIVALGDLPTAVLQHIADSTPVGAK